MAAKNKHRHCFVTASAEQVTHELQHLVIAVLLHPEKPQLRHTQIHQSKGPLPLCMGPTHAVL